MEPFSADAMAPSSNKLIRCVAFYFVKS